MTTIEPLSKLSTVTNLDLTGNWLDTTVGSAAWNVIQGLEHRNAFVSYASQSLPAVVADAVGDALEAPRFPWLTGGAAPWFAQTAEHHDGLSAGQSGAIGDGEESWLRTTVTGPTRVSFWWQVSSEANFDTFEFSTNNVVVESISGEVGWRKLSMDLGLGNQVLMWRYRKDGILNGGRDAANLDRVTIAPIEPTLLNDSVAMLPDSRFQFGIRNPHGEILEIQRCTNLTTRIWESVGIVTDQADRVIFIDKAATEQPHFYRVKRAQ